MEQNKRPVLVADLSCRYKLSTSITNKIRKLKEAPRMGFSNCVENSWYRLKTTYSLKYSSD